MKILTLNLKSCEDCPFTGQDEDAITCWHPKTSGETILTAKEFYEEHKNTKDVHGADFPKFCPLPDRSY